MIQSSVGFDLKLAQTEEDLRGAERLRYRVFVEELGGDGTMVDHDQRLERDAFDAHIDHLVLTDPTVDPQSLDHVVGVYRLMRSDQMPAIGRYYSQNEFDLTPLIRSGRPLLELGRSCVLPEHRGGTAMYLLWQGLADYVALHGIEILFGVASFPGQDLAAIAQPLSLLHHAHLAPPELRPRSTAYQAMDLIAPEEINRPEAIRATPALIKAYLRLGGMIGDGAFVDHAFNTVDVCLVMDTQRLSARHRDIYVKERAR